MSYFQSLTVAWIPGRYNIICQKTNYDSDPTHKLVRCQLLCNLFPNNSIVNFFSLNFIMSSLYNIVLFKLTVFFLSFLTISFQFWNPILDLIFLNQHKEYIVVSVQRRVGGAPLVLFMRMWVDQQDFCSRSGGQL